MKSNIFVVLILLSGAPLLAQRLAGPLPSPQNGIRQNSVSIIEAIGDTVWIGPRLNRNIAPSLDWPAAQGADSVFNGRFSIFSLSLQPDTVVAGLGFYKETAGGSTATAGGFYTSTDGGNSWMYRPPPVDPQGTLYRLAGTDTLRGYFNFPYGNRNIMALAVTVPEQSVPWDVSAKNGVIFTASWASGIRRSLNFGQTWERILLPPFEQPELTPSSTYDFVYLPTPPRSTDTQNPNTAETWTNFLGFAVFIDVQNRVWVGTAGGLNYSDDAMYESTSRISWKHAVATSDQSSIPSNWIIAIRQRPADSTLWMTNWIGTNASGLERFGISSTRDGVTFKRYLMDEKIYDISFSAQTIFATGDNGLFISSDEGRTWLQQRGIQSSNNVITERAIFQGTSTAGDRVWVATSEGLASTADLGKTWSIVRTNFPLAGSNQFETSKKVSTYAYPNPFSVRQHGHVRIRFEVKGTGNVTVQLFDTGMNLVRELGPLPVTGAGEHEVLWDGTDRRGLLVPNGPLFYVVKKPGGTVNGKILMLD
jgi:hypothetical protein